MSDDSHPRRPTVFLTTESGRAPSAYHVDLQSQSQRARQDHRSGPTVTSEERRIQSFTKTKANAHALSKMIQTDAQRLNIDAESSLRLQMLDGLASPRIKYGKAHVEVSQNPFGRGNPHVSGGTVAFPAPDSALSDFDQVSALTKTRKREFRETGAATTPPILSAMSEQSTPQADAFNRQAVRTQKSFVSRLLAWARLG